VVSQGVLSKGRAEQVCGQRKVWLADQGVGSTGCG
jgi:hypothetical protein